MNREEKRIKVRNILQDFYRRGEYELEQATDDVMCLITPLPPAEGAEENRNRIDGLIKKHISIDTANFEFCAKNNTINGSLLQGIRDVVNEFATLHAQRIAEKMVSERLMWIRVSDELPKEHQQVLCYNGYRISQHSLNEYTNQDANWFKNTFTHWSTLPKLPDNKS